jgi:hypothetical protein
MDSERTSSLYEDILKKMRDKGVEFDIHLSRVKKANDELVAKAEKTLSTLHDLVGTVRPAPRTCSVCYTRALTMVIVPCGHAFCTNCTERATQRNPARCFTCRGRIADTLKVYV